MSKIQIVDKDIADITITAKRSLTPIQKKLIESLAFLQMMCITTPEDEPDKLLSFVAILTEAVDKGNSLFNDRETFDVADQF